MSIPAPSLIRFGVFEVDLEARELRKRGIKVKIQGQPFEVLATLLARPGQLVTREQLKASIWERETFVDFDLGLNKAVNRIREVLGDTAATPRFIETLARRGYRFIAPLHAPLSSSDSPRLLRSSLLPPANTSFLPNHFAISPDGRRLAFVAVDSNGKEALWVRDLATAGAQQLMGAQGARLPFWRPDSRQIGFFAEGKLKTIDIAGGAVRALCDARVGGGGAWHSDDIIVFAGQITGPLHRVPATGGTPVPVTPPPADSGQLHCWPVFLPESDRFLYFVNRAGPAEGLGKGLYAGSISSMEAHLVSAEIGGNVAFAAGHLCFVKDGGLSAQPFNPERLRLSGDPVAIAPHEMEIWETVFFHSAFSVSETGVLVFQSRTDFARELVWTDASGNECGRIPGGYWEPHVSPDGRFVAVTSDEFRDGKWYICVHDLERGVTTKLTDGGHEWHPSWSADGRQIQYDSLQGHVSSICEIATDGSGFPQVLVEFGLVAHSSRAGALVFARLLRGSPHLMVRLPGSKETIEWGPGVEPRFSPDGQWIAFTEYGGAGICVRSFPGPGPRIQISSGPGAQPRWSGDGTQLYYVAADKTLMAVSFDAHTGRTGPPRGLFQTRIVRASLIAWQYDVVSDGRCLINSLRSGSPPLTILTGYTSLLKSRRE